MGIFDFLKKKSEESKSEEVKVTVEDIKNKSLTAFKQANVENYFDKACEKYLKVNNKEELDDYDTEIVWAYAGAHISYFLTWLIRNEFYCGIYDEYVNREELVKDLDNIKNGLGDGYMFLTNYCDLRIYRDDIVKEALGFVDAYYDSDYFNDYSHIIENILNKEVFNVSFSWEDYYRVEDELNKAYNEYKTQI